MVKRPKFAIPIEESQRASEDTPLISDRRKQVSLWKVAQTFTDSVAQGSARQYRNELDRNWQEICGERAIGMANDLQQAYRRLSGDCKEIFYITLDESLGNLRRLYNTLNAMYSFYSRVTPTIQCTYADTAQELLSLRKRFPGKFFVSPNGRSISVTTDPITLTYDEYELELGRFRLELQSKVMSDGYMGIQAFSVTALDPYTSSKGYVHPHVSGGGICPGDFGHIFQAALQEGRICDAFDLALSILHTYNPGSPYQQIEVWRHGGQCGNCGYEFADDDDSPSTCHHRHCDGQICYDCRHECATCGEWFCGGHAWFNDDGESYCGEHAHVCQNPHCGWVGNGEEVLRTPVSGTSDYVNLCSSCRGECSECCEEFSSESLSRTNGVCHACVRERAREEREQREEANEESQSEPQAGGADQGNIPFIFEPDRRGGR
jgi:hypothetical protein